MQSLIEDHALIGDCETCALVSRAGSVDFFCWPRFDGDACFAALLGDERNGSWVIAPEATTPLISRRYDGDTLVVQTDYEHPGGTVRIVDFMPAGGPDGGPGSSIVRIVQGLAGTSRLRLSLSLRFDYGTMRPWSRLTERGMLSECGPTRAVLDSPVPLVLHEDAAFGVFVVREGESVAFSLAMGNSVDPVPEPPDTQAALAQTRRFWTDWIGRFDKPCIRPDFVRRSLLTLKAMIHRRTGGLVAAATFGLPEKPRGDMNWDYRYTWLRDATFTLAALLACGFAEEAEAWGSWMQRAVGGDPTRLKIMYRIDGSRDLGERRSTLPGYGGAAPVLIGNEAATQLQLDVYGELLLAMHVAEQGGIERTPRGIEMERMLVEHLARTWNDPGTDIWETRDALRRYTYSQVMAWVGIDRFLRSDRTRSTLDAVTVERLSACRDAIHDSVCTHNYDAAAGHFVQAVGGNRLDASLLLLPLVGFLPVTDARIAGTIAAIEERLTEGGLVRRMPDTVDADGEREGAFLACSCWLADCFHLQGRTDEARALLDRVMGLANEVGLLAEEFHVPTRRLIGNFPQALSHLAVVTSLMLQSGLALRLDG